jgi:branched-subunit amino acid transport protein
MTAVWVTIGVLTVTTAATRAVGPALLGARELRPRVVDVIALLAPALLAALVVVQTLGAPEGGDLEIDARIPGVLSAGAVLAFGATSLPAVAVAAAVTALVRLVG